MLVFHHIWRSLGCLVNSNTHTFPHAWKYAIVCLFKLWHGPHLQHINTLSCWLLQSVLSSCSTLNLFLQSVYHYFVLFLLHSLPLLLSILWCVRVVSGNRWPLTGSGLARASSNPSFFCCSQRKTLPTVMWGVCGLNGCCFAQRRSLLMCSCSHSLSNSLHSSSWCHFRPLMTKKPLHFHNIIKYLQVATTQDNASQNWA